MNSRNYVANTPKGGKEMNLREWFQRSLQKLLGKTMPAPVQDNDIKRAEPIVFEGQLRRFLTDPDRPRYAAIDDE